MAQAKVLSIGGIALPLDIEAMEVLPMAEGGSIQFDFTYRHIHFIARYQESDGKGALKLVGDAGPLPFTAESPAARAGLGQIVVQANDVLGSTFRFAHNRIALQVDGIEVQRPVTATHIIAAIATVLVPATPYLDLIAVYVRPPLAPAAPGEPALRPEWRKGHKPRKPATTS